VYLNEIRIHVMNALHASCRRYMFDSVLGIDLSGDGHSLVTWRQLSDWEECPMWGNFSVRIVSYRCALVLT